MTPLTGSVLRGYRVQQLVGEGAMSSVYLATRRDHPRVALKVLKPHLTHDPRFADRFNDEALALSRLDHDNIVRMHESFQDGPNFCIAMDFVDGESLEQTIQRRGALPEDEALEIFKCLLSALDHAHQHAIIHRDVKSSNVMIARDGRVLLCDFGISKQVAGRGVTVAGTTLGTPEYMSPEQVLPKPGQPIDHRSDVYSAGVVLYEMLTGHVPFESDGTDWSFNVCRQHVETPAPDPRLLNRSIRPGLARIVLKALRKDRQTRFQGCGAMRAAIEAYQRDPDAPPPPARNTDESPAAADAGWWARRYTVFEHPEIGRIVVKQGFSWPAFFLGIFWMLAKGLAGRAALWLGCGIALAVLTGPESETTDDPVRTLVGLVAGLSLWLVPGFRGNAWRGQALLRRGFERRGTITAREASGKAGRRGTPDAGHSVQ